MNTGWSLYVIAIVVLNIAGCGALAGTIGFLNAPRSSESAPPPPSAVRVSPFIGLGVLGLEGSF